MGSPPSLLRARPSATAYLSMRFLRGRKKKWFEVPVVTIFASACKPPLRKKVVAADVAAANGVLHVIDAVLLPGA